MKKIVLLIISLLILGSISSCDRTMGGDGVIVDWAPVNVFIKLQDKSGTDLLNPDNPNNLIDGATITFKGETYEVSRLWYESNIPFTHPETKVYLAEIYGLFLIKDSMFLIGKEDGFSLIFCEIDGVRNMDEDLVVTFRDGTSGTIHYHCDKHSTKRLTCERYWKFNGQKTTSNIFTFVTSK